MYLNDVVKHYYSIWCLLHFLLIRAISLYPSGFELEPYPIISKTDFEQQPLQQQQQSQITEQRPYSEATSLSSDSAPGGVSALGEKQPRLSPIADKGSDSDNSKEFPHRGSIHQVDVSDAFIFADNYMIFYYIRLKYLLA